MANFPTQNFDAGDPLHGGSLGDPWGIKEWVILYTGDPWGIPWRMPWGSQRVPKKSLGK